MIAPPHPTSRSGDGQARDTAAGPEAASPGKRRAGSRLNSAAETQPAGSRSGGDSGRATDDSQLTPNGTGGPHARCQARSTPAGQHAAIADLGGQAATTTIESQDDPLTAIATAASLPAPAPRLATIEATKHQGWRWPSPSVQQGWR